MKLLIATGLIAAVFGLMNGGVASAQTPAELEHRLANSVPMNGINVPLDVLMYAQLQYQGYAVTQAHRITQSGQPVYRLRVDNDDIPDDYGSIQLLYDKEWMLLGNQKMEPPRPKEEPKQPESPKNEDKKERKEDKEDKKEERRGEQPVSVEPRREQEVEKVQDVPAGNGVGED